MVIGQFLAMVVIYSYKLLMALAHGFSSPFLLLVLLMVVHLVIKA
jgi:hypothetical protein